MNIYAITTLRLRPDLMAALKRDASARHISVNSLISQLLEAWFSTDESGRTVSDDEITSSEPDGSDDESQAE